MFQSEEHKEHLAAANDMLKGVSDIHVHAAPDSKTRLIGELSFSCDAHAAGYRAILYDYRRVIYFKGCQVFTKTNRRGSEKKINEGWEKNLTKHEG